ncbi:hypothetical protein NM208_g5750 [Fusarium decemcellulare]|uniref:Uncharacterized protein n=2 Tax=Fusarium decemcellulare TaxID=57161 RepID=A0ACC1SCC1_9HYPO|nr:hypothetical protein NM208_g6630 [Fusarium decemcellulare]KAJ3538790.1 hypothetical protein NM208_g5750 [Fusarium decemcellulare]
MANTYTITIINQSGTTQKYALFYAPPFVNSAIESPVFSNAVEVIPARNADQITFSVTDQFYGYAGIADGTPGVGDVGIVEMQPMPVSLGGQDMTGAATPGTVLQMIIIEGAPQFTGSELGDVPAFGFSILATPSDASNDFTNETAVANHWVIGLGTCVNRGDVQPAATMTPQLSNIHQIKPTNIWYLTFGSYSQGQIYNIEADSASTAVFDFTESLNATVIHNDDGQFTVQTS